MFLAQLSGSVLRRYRPAVFDGHAVDFLLQLLVMLWELSVVAQNEVMDVTVADVAQGHDLAAVFFGQRVDLVKELRQGRRRDRRIHDVRDIVLVRAVGVASDLEQAPLLLLAVRDDAVHRVVLFADGDDFLAVAVKQVLRRLLHDEHQVDRALGAGPCGAELLGRFFRNDPVHIFHGERGDALLKDIRNGVRRVVVIVERNKERAGVAASGVQAQRHLRDDAQHALAADHQVQKVESHVVFQQLAAERDDFAGGQDDLQRLDVVAHDAVLHRARAARVFRDHAADLRAFVAGMHREEQAALFQRLEQGGQRGARFQRDHQVFFIQLDHLVEPLDGKDDARHRRNRAGDDARSAPAHGDGKLLAVGVFQNFGNLLRVRGLCHDTGARRLRPQQGLGLVVQIALDFIGCVDGPVLPDDFPKLPQHFFR